MNKLFKHTKKLVLLAMTVVMMVSTAMVVIAAESNKAPDPKNLTILTVGTQNVDKDGNLIPTPIEERLISTPLERLKETQNVIGLAAGAEKIEAIRAVLRGGYLDVLITDETTANLLLKDE